MNHFYEILMIFSKLEYVGEILINLGLSVFILCIKKNKQYYFANKNRGYFRIIFC